MLVVKQKFILTEKISVLLIKLDYRLLQLHEEKVDLYEINDRYFKRSSNY